MRRLFETPSATRCQQDFRTLVEAIKMLKGEKYMAFGTVVEPPPAFSDLQEIKQPSLSQHNAHALLTAG
jgi:hypothetical protein